jgi:hypothetical protein
VRELLSQGARGAEQIMQATRRFLGPSYPSDPVRRIYAQLLRRAEARGLPRPLDATPWEFERLLVARWPEGSQDFAAVTLAYVHRRYGRSLVAGRELDDLQRRGKRLRGLMRERKPAPFR